MNSRFRPRQGHACGRIGNDLLGPVAGDTVAGLEFPQRRHLVLATFGTDERAAVWKVQPDGGAAGDGMSPVSTMRVRLAATVGSGMGAAASNARV
jgi:hypothetical protein